MNIVGFSFVELLSKSQYALLALLELTAYYPSSEPLQIRQIATLQDIPNRYLEQLLATLRRGGLIKSIRGAKGGYILTREPWKITVLDALSCVDGLDTAMPVKNATSKKVEDIVIQEIWQEACQAANSVLQKYTLQDLYERRIAKQPKEPMYYI